MCIRDSSTIQVKRKVYRRKVEADVGVAAGVLAGFGGASGIRQSTADGDGDGEGEGDGDGEGEGDDGGMGGGDDGGD